MVLIISTLTIGSTELVEDEVIVSIENININLNTSNKALLSIAHCENLGSFTVSLSWDPDVIEVINVGNEEMTEIFYYIDAEKGTLNLTGYTLGSLTGDMVSLAEIFFETTETAIVGDNTTLLIEESYLLTAEPVPSNIDHIPQHGMVVITENPEATVLNIDDVQLLKPGSNTTQLTIFNGENIGSCNVSLTWDPAIAAVVNVSDGDFDSMSYYLDAEAGILNITAFTMVAITRDVFQVARIEFQSAPASQVGDSCLLLIEESLLLTADPTPSDIDHLLDHGRISIIEDTSIPVVGINDVRLIELGSGNTSVYLSHVENLGSCEVTLTWDPEIVEVVNISVGDFDSLSYYLDQEDGIVNLSVFTMDAIYAEMVSLAEIMFKAVESAEVGDTTSLFFLESLLLTADPTPSEIEHTQRHGLITIEDVHPDLPCVIIDDMDLVEQGSGKTSLYLTNGENLGTCEVTVTWDPAVAEIVNVSDGDFESLYVNVDNHVGVLNILAVSQSAITMDVVSVAEILFNASDTAIAGDTTELMITESLLLTADPIPIVIDHDQEHGMITIISTGELLVDAGGPYKGKTHKNIQLSGTASGGHPPYSYAWDLDDDGLFNDASGSQPLYSWDSKGTKPITLQVTDSAEPPSIAFDASEVKISNPSSDEDDTGGTYNWPTQNNPPEAKANITPLHASVHEIIRYDASESTDDGDIEAYAWDFGDGAIGSGITTTHSYTNEGTYHVVLTVTDNQGLKDALDNPILIMITQANNPPGKPLITGPSSAKKNVELSFTITANDPDTNDTLNYTIDWDDNTPYTLLTNKENGANNIVNHTWKQPRIYQIHVSVKDQQDLPSGETIHVLSIDAYPIDDVIKGVLLDYDSDGIYDTYQDDGTGMETNVSHHNTSWYRIDVDDDGKWDYDFDVATDTLKVHTAQKTIKEDDYSLCLLILLILLIFIVLGYVVYQKEQKKKQKEVEKKREEEEKKGEEEEQKRKEEEKRKEQEEKKKEKKKSSEKKASSSKKEKTKKQKSSRKKTKK